MRGLPLLAITVLMAACSAAPSGPASISGTVTLNGEPVADEDITLGPGTAPPEASPGAMETPDTRPKAMTGADGVFEFGPLEPGSYSLSVGVTVSNAAFESAVQGGFYLNWDKPCQVGGGFMVLNAGLWDDKTREPFGVIAVASNQLNQTNADEVRPITVGSGEQVTVDIAFVCEMR